MPTSSHVRPEQLERLTLAVSRTHQAASEQEAAQVLADEARELARARVAELAFEDLRAVAPAGATPDPVALSVPPLALSGPPEGGFTAADRLVLTHLAHLGTQALESVRLRARLKRQEERLRLALEAASLGSWEHRPLDDNATTWDARCKEILGLGATEPLDFPRFVEAVHPDDRAILFGGIARATDPSGNGECSLQYRIRRADGALRWIEAHGRCIFVDGQASRIHGTLLDITDRKQAEERKDAFLAILGHELRNPLAPIRTALDLMARQDPDRSVREREVIDRQVRHMIRLVDDLLDLSRIARGAITLRRERVTLAAGVAQAVEIAAPLVESRGHHLEVEVPDDLVLEGDPVRIAQIVANLLTNAARYTPPGGWIEIRARQDGGELELEVADNGIGLDEDQLDQLFEPFVQASRIEEQAHGGLGLGLPLVRDLVQLHDGSITATSDGPGQGSRFFVRLPSAPRDTVAEPDQTGAPLPPSDGRRILVVDDNEDAARLVGELLEMMGNRVKVACDGPTALDLAEGFRPELAILDLGLPVMDGFELAARLRDTHPELRLVALTGFGQPGDRERTASAGFDAHLVKPVEVDELQAALQPPVG